MGSNSLPQPHTHSLSRNRALLCQLLSVFHSSLDNVRQANCRRWSDVELRWIPPDVQVWTLRYDVSDEGNVSLFLLFFSFLLFFPPNAPHRHLEKYMLINCIPLFNALVFSVQLLADDNPQQARQILADNPRLARFVFQVLFWFVLVILWN